MNDKVVSNEVKMAMSLTLMAFSAFMEIVSQQIENSEAEDDKFDIFLDLSLKHSDAMEKLRETMTMHRPEHLTVNGCIAILLDMSSAANIDKVAGHVLNLDIERHYLTVQQAIQVATEMVFEEVEI